MAGRTHSKCDLNAYDINDSASYEMPVRVMWAHAASGPKEGASQRTVSDLSEGGRLTAPLAQALIEAWAHTQYKERQRERQSSGRERELTTFT